MILCDASPLFALVSHDQVELHDCCTQTFRSIREPLITTWVCFGEAMHLLGRKRRLHHQLALWDLAQTALLNFYHPTSADVGRMRELMVTYGDHPMDLGDASLVIAAEALNIRRIFTFDHHFYSFLIHDKTPFDVIPSLPPRSTG